nr:MAG TPA: hypothetical protein [Caudoviricetes sp.]
MMPSTMQYGTFLENPPLYLSHLAPGSAIHLYRRNAGDVIGIIYIKTDYIDISAETVAAETEYFKIRRPSADLPEDAQREGWLQIEKEIREIFKHLGWIRTYESAQYG